MKLELNINGNSNYILDDSGTAFGYIKCNSFEIKTRKDGFKVSFMDSDNNCFL